MSDSTCALFTLRTRYWHPWPSGDVFITLGGEPNTASTVDLKDDLDLDAGNEWMVGADVRMGRHRIRFAYEPLSFEGKNVLDRPVIYHGVTYPAGSSVTSDIDLTLYEAGYQYALVDKCNDTLWGGLAAWVWTYDGTMKTTGIDESRSFTHVYPVATFSGEHRFGNWKVAGGVNVGGLATDRYVVDLEASAGVRLFGHLDLEVGYRWMEFDFHETTNKASMNFSGPFAGIAYEF